jgi:hypothetical protein
VKSPLVAALMAGLFGLVITATIAAAPAHADATKCSGGGKPDRQVAPEFYQEQYSAGLVKSLKKDLSKYDSAVAANDVPGIGTAGGTLYSEILSDMSMIDDPVLFGCYNSMVQTELQDATNAWSPTLDAMACAGANMCSHTASDMPGLVAKSKPQKKAYITTLNDYASQFGGEEIPE